MGVPFSLLSCRWSKAEIGQKRSFNLGLLAIRQRTSAVDDYIAEPISPYTTSGSKLVMTHKGQAFELAFNNRQLDSGQVVCRACDALQQTTTRLYRQAGIKQRSSHSGRRSLAAKVLAATVDVETVQTILGHVSHDHSKPYLTVDMAVIQRAFELALA